MFAALRDGQPTASYVGGDGVATGGVARYDNGE
jgi:hypothetical protein